MGVVLTHPLTRRAILILSLIRIVLGLIVLVLGLLVLLLLVLLLLVLPLLPLLLPLLLLVLVLVLVLLPALLSVTSAGSRAWASPPCCTASPSLPRCSTTKWHRRTSRFLFSVHMT